MKRFLIILGALAIWQALIFCGAGLALGVEAATGCPAVVKTEQPVSSNEQSAKVQQAVAKFVKELNGNQTPKTGTELTCCQFETAVEALSFVRMMLLLHPDKETFPYDRNKGCYDYRSEYLQLQFKEPGSVAGVFARIDIRFSTAYGDVKAGAEYTVFFKKR